MICPDVFEKLHLGAVVKHQLQGFGADSFVPIRLPYPVAHLAVVFSDRNVAGFVSVVADAAYSLGFFVKLRASIQGTCKNRLIS